jgi:hypothetical protein
MDWRGWASATSGVAQELPRSCPKAGVDLLSEMVMGVGVNVDSGFRRKDDGDRGWGYVDSGFRRKDDGDRGWGYVDSGFRRKDLP